MYISIVAGRSGGFKSWSDAHPSASNDDDDPAGAASVALAVPSFDDITRRSTQVVRELCSS
jgi:hypothetical protein